MYFPGRAEKLVGSIALCSLDASSQNMTLPLLQHGESAHDVFVRMWQGLRAPKLTAVQRTGKPHKVPGNSVDVACWLHAVSLASFFTKADKISSQQIHVQEQDGSAPIVQCNWGLDC